MNHFHGILVFVLMTLTSVSALAADIVFGEVQGLQGKIQTCTRYPDPQKFPGKRPTLMFIQGSGPHEMCSRLNRPLVKSLTEKGIIFFYHQKLGISLDAGSGQVKIDRQEYLKNDLPTLKANAITAFESLIEDPLVDQENIALIGGSEGTLLVTAIAQKFPSVRDVTLVSGPFERLETAILGQLVGLIPQEILAELDTDKNGKLDGAELTPEYLKQRDLADFEAIDENSDGFVDDHELGQELNREFAASLMFEKNIFPYEVLGVGLAWIKSAFLQTSLGDELMELKMPVHIHHAELDINTSVEPVYKFERLVLKAGMRNFSFQYYHGVGHELNPIYTQQIFQGIAELLLTHTGRERTNTSVNPGHILCRY